MPETRKQQRPDQVEEYGPDTIAERLRGARPGLTSLLGEAEKARRQRAEATAAADGAVCAWNHFENIPTFYNWNNRPR
ncbi:hypothetical protein GCM10027280_36680 [Micromonospora polyrhachis]|uniref:Uncharacterized protein n=1 Tax=Micromonospora polyrhachis TaxID=1282883 RepID=A0A7W7SPU0_9ACTN|nr:multiple cyclophane-containing RiPP AmcA [Micromonospora polyrhachis]MBB4958724.1 hypothetical protein [Micromonospora polyrhachis]